MDRRILIRIRTKISWIGNTGAEGKHGRGKVRSPEAWDNVWPGTDRCGRLASCRIAGSAAQCYCSAGQRWTAPSLPLPVHKKKTFRTFSLFLPSVLWIPQWIRNFWLDPGKKLLIRIRAPPGPKWIWNKTSKNYSVKSHRRLSESRHKIPEEGYHTRKVFTISTGTVSDFREASRNLILQFLHKKTAINCEKNQLSFTKYRYLPCHYVDFSTLKPLSL